MALEDGEDVEELADRNRKRGKNKLPIDVEVSGRSMPVSDFGSRARKASVPDYARSPGSKRKRAVKSATPSVSEDDDDGHQSVGAFSRVSSLIYVLLCSRNAAKHRRPIAMTFSPL
ncbi:hypothetical protein B0H13DRAFT_2128969, partial [Mycena leptocephala]